MTSGVLERIEVISITRENEAWAELEKALHADINENSQIKFEGWPVLKLTFTGEDFDGTIPTRLMPPLLDLQSEIFKLYSEAHYKSRNSNKLTNEERDALELIIEIKGGSSKIITDLCNSLNEAIKNSKMTGPQVVILFLGISLLIAGATAWLATVESDERKHGMDTYTSLSAEETKRMQLLSEALSKVNELHHHKEAITDFHRETAKRLKPTDQLQIDDRFIINGEHAAEILRSPREATKEIRLDDIYSINYVKPPKEFGGPYKLSVTSIATGQDIRVDVASDIPDNQFQILKHATFDLKPVFMKINAKENRGNTFDASLVSIEWPPKKSKDIPDNQ